MEQELALEELRQRIKKLRAEKNRISGQFTRAKGQPERLAALRQTMREVSTELKAFKKRRKILESLIHAFQAADQEVVPDFPERFHSQTPASGQTGSVTVEKIDNSAAQEWDDYVSRNPRAALYHHYCWRRIIEDAFGHQCHYYVARNQAGRICGVLPSVKLGSKLFGRFSVSLPYFNYGGPLADDQHSLLKLMEAAGADARKLGLRHIEYRSCEDGYPLPGSERKVSMIMRLPADQDSLEQNLGSKVRAQYKQANQYSPVLKFGGWELLDDFYQVFARVMRDLGTPVYGKSFFETILRHQNKRATIVCVYIDNQAVAAGFLLGFRDMLEIPWAAALREYNHCNVNMWMYRQILGFAIDSGYGYFDFGRSTVDAGTYRFKKQWGAKPLQNIWYYQFPDEASGTREEALPALNPENPRFRLAIAAWKRMPLFVANRLGPRIVKNLP